MRRFIHLKAGLIDRWLVIVRVLDLQEVVTFVILVIQNNRVLLYGIFFNVFVVIGCLILLIFIVDDNWSHITFFVVTPGLTVDINFIDLNLVTVLVMVTNHALCNKIAN